MSDATLTKEQKARDDANALARSLVLVLAAIDKARDVGCIEHLDCWDDSEAQFYKPIQDARMLLKGLQYD